MTLFLALWILILSSNVSVNLHFCQNSVKSFSFVGDAPNCHEIMAKKTSCSAKKACKKTCSAPSSNLNKPCCTNKDVQFELDADLPHFEISDIGFSVDQHIFIAPIIAYNFNFVKPVEALVFQHYRPPPLVNEHIVLYQQFLC